MGYGEEGQLGGCNIDVGPPPHTPYKVPRGLAPWRVQGSALVLLPFTLTLGHLDAATPQRYIYANTAREDKPWMPTHLKVG